MRGPAPADLARATARAGSVVSAIGTAARADSPVRRRPTTRPATRNPPTTTAADRPLVLRAAAPAALARPASGVRTKTATGMIAPRRSLRTVGLAVAPDHG